MTIKSRNRINLIFVFFSLSIFVLNLLYVIYQFFKGNFVLPDFNFSIQQGKSTLTDYDFYYVVASILYLLFYTCVTSVILLRSFEKTQSSEISFFLLFLFGLIFDSSRLLIPFLHVSNTFTKLLILIGNATLFSRIITPLSVLGMAVLNDESMRQDIEQNCLIIFVASLFFAYYIPLNTATILPNLSVSFSFKNFILIASFIIEGVAVFSLHLQNIKNDLPQITTIGLLLLCVGFNLLFECVNLLELISGVISLSAGTFIYSKQLHNQYLWNF